MTAIANNTTKFSDESIWTVLIEAEKNLPVDIGLDYLIGHRGRLSLYAKDNDKWLGHKYFSLDGVEDLSEFFTILLSEHKKVAA